MKKIILVALLLNAVVSFAQHDYMPMIKPGRVWITTNDNSTIRTIMEVRNDTIVNGEQWYVLAAYPENNPEDSRSILTREYERRVYMRSIEDDADEQDECLVLDFGLETGDVVNMGYNYTVEKDFDVIRGIRRDVLLFYDQTDSVGQVWMEGVGIVNSKTLIDINVPMFLENGTRLVACYQDDECLYYDHATKIDATPWAEAMPGNAIYDVMGRKVNPTTSKGVYIRGGKKCIYQ